MSTRTFTAPPVSAIADVLMLWGLDGWLTPPMSPVVPTSSPVLGRVTTVTIEVAERGPGLAPIYDVLSGDLSDRFVILAGARPLPGAVFGELLALSAQQRGALGVLVDGGVRDVATLSHIGLPVYSVDRRVAGPGPRAHVTAIDQAVTVGAVRVGVDDVVVADEGGCVRIAAADVDRVIAAASRYAAGEDLVAEALRQGELLSTAYRHKKSIVDELRR